MKIKPLFFTVHLFLLSCMLYGQDQYEEIRRYAESSVQKHIKSSMADLGVYRSFGFGEVEIIVPYDIRLLNELREKRKTASGMKDYFGQRYDSVMRSYDTLIAKQERMIEQYHIRNNYKVDHIFSLNKNAVYTVYEVEFFLSANFHVKNARVKMSSALSKEDYDWFNYYFMGYELFTGGSPEENSSKTAAVYEHFGNRLSEENVNKDDLLRSTVIAVKTTRKNDVFDPNLIAKEVIVNWMNLRISEFPNYTRGDFSVVNGIYNTNEGKEELIGYSVFHRFTSKNQQSEMVLQCLYFELDAWFVVAGTMLVEPPFDKYFEAK